MQTKSILSVVYYYYVVLQMHIFIYQYIERVFGQQAQYFFYKKFQYFTESIDIGFGLCYNYIKERERNPTTNNKTSTERKGKDYENRRLFKRIS